MFECNLVLSLTGPCLHPLWAAARSEDVSHNKRLKTPEMSQNGVLLLLLRKQLFTILFEMIFHFGCNRKRRGNGVQAADLSIITEEFVYQLSVAEYLLSDQPFSLEPPSGLLTLT